MAELTRWLAGLALVAALGSGCSSSRVVLRSEVPARLEAIRAELDDRPVTLAVASQEGDAVFLGLVHDHQGRDLRLEAAGLAWSDADGAARSASLQAVQELRWTPEAVSARWRGAWEGAAFGALAGAAAGAGLGFLLGNDPLQCFGTGAAVRCYQPWLAGSKMGLAGGVGLVGGALLGGLIGALVGHREVIVFQ